MKIAVLGGGIGGLTTAIALQKKGFEVNVYESAPELKAVGAGLGLAANAVKAFQHIGIAQKILAVGKLLQEFTIMDEKGRTITNTNSVEISQQYGVDNFTIHRAALHSVLMGEIAPGSLHTGKRCKSFSLNNNGVNVVFTDGTEINTDYLIAADGIHSVVRQTLIPESKPRYAGYTCWRGVTETEPANFNNLRATESWGKNGRFGIVPLAGGKIYWFACVNAPQNDAKLKAFSKEDIYAIFKDYHAPVPQIIELTPAEKILNNDIIDLPPLKQFAFDRILLLGDAAHATTPNMGQGACQAIEDAAFLAEYLTAYIHDPENAFRLFEQKRLARTTHIVNTSWRIGKAAQLQNSILASLRNTALRLLPPKFNQKQLKYLYDIDFKIENYENTTAAKTA